MDLISSAMLLWLGFTSMMFPPVYEAENFYTYNNEHIQVPLFCQKVFVPDIDKNVEAYLSKIQSDYKFDKLKIKGMDWFEYDKRKFVNLEEGTNGWVVNTKSKNDLFKLMKMLSNDKIFYLPVVSWEGMDCIPTSTLIVKAKPFVTEGMLRLRLAESSKLKLMNINKKEDLWYLTVSDINLPPNILVVANMLAEDTAWFDWARVKFKTIYEPVSGYMFVTSPASLNLGYDKQLEIVINVLDPNLKVRMDLLPKIGQSFWPMPQKDEVWYDIGQTTITEEKTSEKTVIRMVTPFKYLNYGAISIPSMQIAYESGKEKNFCTIDGILWNTQSIIQATEINDIQVIPKKEILMAPEPGVFSKVLLPWQILGLCCMGLSAVIFLIICCVAAISHFNDFSKNRMIKLQNRYYWDELLKAPKASDNWRTAYAYTTLKLAKVLDVFYGIKIPISSDEVGDNRLHNILVELEKLYQQNPEPDVNKLIENVKYFVEASGKYV